MQKDNPKRYATLSKLKIPQLLMVVLLCYAGWYFRRTPDNKCHTVFVAHLDPKGWLPALIVNQISLDQCANVKRCKARVEGKAVEA